MTKAESTVERVGAYRVVRKLASTAACDVLLAKTDGPLGSERAVVLKVFALRDDHELERSFARETSAYSRLAHPTIVRLLDFFALPVTSQDGGTPGRAGHLCIVLEHVDGPSLVRLRTLLKAGAQELDDRAAILVAASVFEALAVAHGAVDGSGARTPMVHRDVNPSNVLISWDGQVKLADFGIVRITGPTHASQTVGTKGSYGYMAPEQIRDEELTQSADIYAAGVILWELLTKRRAFQRGALPEEEALRAMAEPRLPSLETLRPDLHPNVLEVVRRALEPRAEQRTITAEEALAMLGASVSMDDARQQLASALSAVRASADSHGASLPPRPSLSPERTLAPSIPPPPATKRGVAPPSDPDIASANAAAATAATVVDPARREDGDIPRRASVTNMRKSVVDAGPVKGTSATARLAFSIPDLPVPATSPTKTLVMEPRPGIGHLPPAPPPMVSGVTAGPDDSEQPTQPLTRTLPLQPLSEPPRLTPPQPPVRSTPPLALPGGASAMSSFATPPVPSVGSERPRSGPPVVVASTPKRPNRALPVIVTAAILGVGVVVAYGRRPTPLETKVPASTATTATSTAEPVPVVPTTEPTSTSLPVTPSTAPEPTVAATTSAALPVPTPTAAPDDGALPADMGRIHTTGAVSGRRIFVDDKTVGQTPMAVIVKCGRHTVRLGSAGKPQILDVPCRGDVSISTKP